MAAELFVRTTKPIYGGGDVMYGAVYLKISSPTSAFGVWIRFSGKEQVFYHSSSNKAGSCGENEHHDVVKYLPSDNAVLYEFDGPIALGSYVFPFCKTLPLDLPASTEIKFSESEKAMVVYLVEAGLTGGSATAASQTIIIKHMPSGTGESKALVETKQFSVQTSLPFVSQQMDVSASLDMLEYVVGDNIKLKLNLKINGLIKPSVSYMSFQLLREVLIKSGISRDISCLKPMCDDNKAVMNKEFLYTDGSNNGEPTVVWDSGRIYESGRSPLAKGFDELLIPLRNVAPTTAGKHINISYSIRMEILLQYNNPISFKLPVEHIWQRPTDWHKWKPPIWLYSCRVMSSSRSPYSVSDEVLGSTEFSSLPAFQLV